MYTYHIVQLFASLTELISWLQSLASQLDQQSPVGDTLKDVQAQYDRLMVRITCRSLIIVYFAVHHIRNVMEE